MIKRPVVLIVAMIVSLSLAACQKAKEPESKKSAQAQSNDSAQQPFSEAQNTITKPPVAETKPISEITGQQQSANPAPSDTRAKEKETVPLITEVMSKEELQVYLKEKGIPIIKKEDFKEPELVWEKTFDESIESIQSISDLTNNENSIIVTGANNSPQQSLLFLDNKGNIRKKVAIGNKVFAVAKGGYAAIMAEWKEKTGGLTITYYTEEGKEVWQKEVKLRTFEKVLISDNGEAIGIQEGNPRWSTDEWQAGNLNESRIVFLDNKGNQPFEFKDFRNIGWGEFSGDGSYYAGLFWWQDDTNREGMKAWGKLIYINAKEGKILWEKPFGGNWWKWGEQFGEDGYLAVTEKGSYIAAVDLEPAESVSEGSNVIDYYEVALFDREGEKIVRIKTSNIWRITEKGLLLTGGGQKQLLDLTTNKFILGSKKSTQKTAYRPDPTNPKVKSLRIIERGAVIDDINIKKYIVYSTRVQEEKGINRFENFIGDLLFERQSNVVADFSLDGNYFKTLGISGNQDKVSIFKLTGGQHE